MLLRPATCNCGRNIDPLFRIVAAKLQDAKFRALPSSGSGPAIDRYRYSGCNYGRYRRYLLPCCSGRGLSCVDEPCETEWCGMLWKRLARARRAWENGEG
jgi:hypothetical protein